MTRNSMESSNSSSNLQKDKKQEDHLGTQDTSRVSTCNRARRDGPTWPLEYPAIEMADYTLMVLYDNWAPSSHNAAVCGWRMGCVGIAGMRRHLEMSGGGIQSTETRPTSSSSRLEREQRSRLVGKRRAKPWQTVLCRVSLEGENGL